MLHSWVAIVRGNAATVAPPLGLPKWLLLSAAVVGLSLLPEIVQQTAAADKAAAAQPAAARLLTQEPIEFEKNPRGYPAAQIEVRDLAFSPDGKLLAGGYGKWDTAGEIVVYDFATQRVLKKFPAAKGVASLAFSVDGKFLAASMWNNLIWVWDTATWELVADKVSGSKVARLAFSPDGKYLAYGTEAGELKLLGVGGWDEARAFSGELFRFQKVAFSSDSQLLCAVGGSFEQPRFGRGLVFEVESGKQIAKFESEGAVIASAAFSPDGQELATGEYGSALRFWEPRTGKALAAIEIGGTMDTLEYTKNGLLVGPSYAGEVHLVQNRRVLRSFSGHVGRSLTARISPDGKTLVSGGVDAVIRIWDPQTGAPTGTLRPIDVPQDTQEAVLAIAHAPDGRLVATAHEDGTVRLREAESGRFIRLIEGHEDVVGALAFSPDSRTLATGSYDQTVKLWDAASGEEIRTLAGHTNWVFSVAFSPDGKTLASSGYDKTVRLWNLSDGDSHGDGQAKPETVLEGHAAAVRALAFSPDGRRLVSGSSDRTLRVWDLSKRETVHELKGHTGAIRAVAWSPDGGRIASASEDQTIRYWSADTGASQQELKGHTGMVWCLAFSPRGRTLASGGFDNAVRIWDGVTGAPLQTLSGHQDVVTSLSYAPDAMALVTGSYDKSLKLWTAIEAPTPALVDLMVGDDPTAPAVRFVAFSPDGTTMVTGNQNRGLRAWDLETGRVTKTVFQPRGVTNGTFSRDGRFLVTSGYGEQVYLWDGPTLKPLATLETGHGEMITVAFSPDGKLVAAGARDGAMMVWDTETYARVHEFPLQEMPVEGLAFSPDGKLLASATGNFKEYQKPGQVKLWDVATWAEVADLEGPARKMRRVEFSPDGRTLIACGAQPELLVYDVPNRKLTARLPIGTEVSDAAFLPDDRTLVLGGYDGRVELWSLDTKKRLVNYDGHRAGETNRRYVFDVAVSADASVVASAGADGHVKLWSTASLPPVTPLAAWQPEGEPLSVALSPDGTRSAVGVNKTVEVRDVATGEVLATIANLNTKCAHIAFSPDGRTLAGAMIGGGVFLWDAQTGEQRRVLLAHPGGNGARRAVFSPDGKWLATCGWDETAAVWNVADGSIRYRTAKLGLSVSDVAFSPDGKLLATATGSWKDWRQAGSVIFWKAADGQKIAELGSHEAEIKGIAFDAGGHFFVTYGGNGAKLWSRNDRKLVRGIGPGTTITAAAFSPDGGTLYTGDRSGRMLAYDVSTGRVRRTLAGHDALVYSVAATADGTLIASASKDGAVKLWPASRIPAVSPLAQITDDPVESLAVAYSPDGRLLAVGGKDKTISLHDADTGEKLREIPGHDGMVYRLAFTPDGRSLVSGGGDGTVRLWDVADGQELAQWTAHGAELSMVRSLAVSPDGRRVAAGNWAGETFVWDLPTRQELYRLPTQPLPVGGVAFSPDGRRLVTCTGNWREDQTPGQLKLWDAATGKEQATLDGHTAEIKGAFFSGDGRTLISFGADNTLRLWDVATARLTRTIDHETTVTAADLFDGRYLAFGDLRGGMALTDLREGGTLWQTRAHASLLGGLVFSPDGARLASVAHDGDFKLWPAQAPAAAVAQFPAEATARPVSLAERVRDWKPLVLEGRRNRTAVRVKQMQPHGEQVWFAVYSPDGSILATGGHDRTVKLWDAQTFEPLRTLTGHESFTSYAAFSPDGQRLASVSWDKTVRLWDVATGQVIAAAQGHEAGCRRVAFSPDGSLIATASEDGTVRLWKGDSLVQTLSVKMELPVYSVAFSPDGGRLAVGTGDWRAKKDGRITLLDPQTGKSIKTLENSDGVVFHLQFLKDGRHLLAANAGAGAAIWNVETGRIEETYHTAQDARWVEISRDEKRIVATHASHMVSLWNRGEMNPFTTFQGSEKFIHCATLSPDGERLAIGDEASSLSIWELRDAPARPDVETTKAD